MFEERQDVFVLFVLSRHVVLPSVGCCCTESFRSWRFVALVWVYLKVLLWRLLSSPKSCKGEHSKTKLLKPEGSKGGKSGLWPQHGP